MPRPYTPDEPLRLTPALLTETLTRVDSERLRVRRAADGRTVVEDPSRHWWVGVDLACLCADRDEPCRHQLVAALLRGHPVTGSTAAVDRLLALRTRLRALADARPPVTADDPSLVAGGPARGQDLTDPALSEQTLHIAVLVHTTASDTSLLSLAPLRRPGPLRTALWEHWTRSVAHTRRPTEREWTNTLGRFLRTATATEIPVLVGPDLPERLQPLVARILALDPELATRVAAALPPATLAHLLATVPDRSLRLALARGVARRGR